ncbi:hypothetical protein [Frankia sp. AgB32]|uniref:non-homologous end-joining DNA ligase LigD n=1 Tax=Frankia sp. AgB32 TaxID=631119 RepID=UPI00200EEF5A|nr:hypothetical protein [Frankia sp. AgB32]MCK9897873.1 hypothetical protein [Frankia sp. AgB32]
MGSHLDALGAAGSWDVFGRRLRLTSVDKVLFPVDSPTALVWAANFGALEWHAWTSPIIAPRHPSYMLVDLDPGTATSSNGLLTLARLHRSALAHLQVRAAPILTGRRGIQIWIPVPPGTTFDETRPGCRSCPTPSPPSYPTW